MLFLHDYEVYVARSNLDFIEDEISIVCNTIMFHFWKEIQ